MIGCFKTSRMFIALVTSASLITASCCGALRAAETVEQNKAGSRPASEEYVLQLQQELEQARQQVRAQANVVDAMSKKLQEQERQQAAREKQLTGTIKAVQEQEQQRRPQLPPIENGQVKVYPLKYLAPREAAQTIESLFGVQALRIAVDDRSNALIVYGKPESFPAVDALVDRLDKQAAPANAAEKSNQSVAAMPRSLLLRVFWLADGLPEGEGQNAELFLPESVLRATNKLGLEAPRLVTQTVNSLAVSREDTAEFSTNVPAVVLGQPTGLGCEGRLRLVSDDFARLEMGIHVNGSANCDLKGSLVTPLGHYVVLGTANSLVAEGGPAGDMNAPGVAASPFGSIGGPGSPDLPGPGGRFYGQPGPGGRMRAPGSGVPEAGGPGAGGQQPAKPNFSTLHYAFVVQVNEGQSYAADQSNRRR
jgi:hypothetical protein